MSNSLSALLGLCLSASVAGADLKPVPKTIDRLAQSGVVVEDIFIKKNDFAKLQVPCICSLTGKLVSWDTKLYYYGQINDSGDLGFEFVDDVYQRLLILRNNLTTTGKTYVFVGDDVHKYHAFKATMIPSKKENDGFVRFRIYYSKKNE